MPGEYTTEALQAHFDNTNQRLAAIEDTLKRICDSIGLPYSTWTEEQGVPDEVVQLATSGDKLGAVKRLRELTGVDFEQARDVVAGL
jgi:ribosomal protein L7/L12